MLRFSGIIYLKMLNKVTREVVNSLELSSLLTIF